MKKAGVSVGDSVRVVVEPLVDDDPSGRCPEFLVHEDLHADRRWQ